MRSRSQVLDNNHSSPRLYGSKIIRYFPGAWGATSFFATPSPPPGGGIVGVTSAFTGNDFQVTDMRLLPIEQGKVHMTEIFRRANLYRRWAGTEISLSDEELKRLVAEGRASSDPVDGKAALIRLRAKYAAMKAMCD